MIRRTCLVVLLSLTGCQGISGPLAYRKPERVDDPRLPISEQEARGRNRYSYIEDTRLTPRAYVDRPDVVGR